MSEITDINDIPITFLSYTIPESTDGPLFVLRIPVLVGHVLTATDNPNARVLVRRTGTADAFVDIQTSPIDLDSFVTDTVDFDAKIHTNAIVGLVSTAVDILVSP